jgi:hypothetical protein
MPTDVLGKELRIETILTTRRRAEHDLDGLAGIEMGRGLAEGNWPADQWGPENRGT